MDTVVNWFAFAVLTLLWLGFAAVLLLNRPLLARAWEWFRSLPRFLQLLLGLLTLPVLAGLWIWQARWPAWLRLALIAGLAWMTIYTFYPQWA